MYLIDKLYFCSWLYRIRPSVLHKPFKRIEQGHMTNKFSDWYANPNQVEGSALAVVVVDRVYVMCLFC